MLVPRSWPRCLPKLPRSRPAPAWPSAWHSAWPPRAASGRCCPSRRSGCASGSSAIHQGAIDPARRRSSRSGMAPSRTSRGTRPVQSTSVEGGTFPNAPPSRISNSPVGHCLGKELADALRSRRCRAAGPVRGGRSQWVPENRDQLRHAGVGGPAHGDPALLRPGVGPAASPRRREQPVSTDPARTRVRAPARADRATSPHASSIAVPLTSSRNGLLGARPLSRARRSRPRSVGA